MASNATGDTPGLFRQALVLNKDSNTAIRVVSSSEGAEVNGIGAFSYNVPVGSGNAAALDTNSCIRALILAPNGVSEGNSDDVFIGPSGSVVFPLAPGFFLLEDIDNTNRYLVYSNTSGQTLKVLYWTSS